MASSRIDRGAELFRELLGHLGAVRLTKEFAELLGVQPHMTATEMEELIQAIPRNQKPQFLTDLKAAVDLARESTLATV